MERRFTRVTMLLGVVGTLVAICVFAFALVASAEQIETDGDAPVDQVTYSHRFIVELESPPLAVRYRELPGARSTNGMLAFRSAAAQAYVQQLQAEQATLMANVRAVLPQARVSTYINEQGAEVQETFQVVINAVVVDAGVEADEATMGALQRLPGVKAVYRDYAYYPQLYTSTHLINADDLWPMLLGRADAGRGVKVASMDGGVHHEAPMFSGEGFDYPLSPFYPEGGLGLTANNNGKIIASRVYFRSWDPPAPGDENPWPGENGISHGVHTAGIAAGNVVTDATYLGTQLPTLSGVAPGAWVGSYRVFYASVRGDGSFYTAEGIAALEDIVKDGMDVVNNSWGAGPGSIGGEFDALDTALINTVKAGVFVSMSAGNAGPFPGTGDHPSPDYINVAATTSGGTYAAGRVSVTAPEPVSDTLRNSPFGIAQFGPPLPVAQVISYTFRAAANVDSNNVEGCDPFPANAFDGVAAVISRGTCNFSIKVYNAQNAGASFAVIYNNAGDGTINMAAGDFADDVNISSVFVGETFGDGLVAWHADHGDDAVLSVDTFGFQAGNIPDVLADFSSRGPSTRNSLKPDIAAPGVNIMSQGYDALASGEARHLGFGQVSGTSMASPHVAGAAALLLQAHPAWTPAEIKSALMSTAKYTDVYNTDGTPAQPIDMGAGRLDVHAAVDPGVILNPPSADLGLVISGTQYSTQIEVRNITNAAETYDISTLYTGNGFGPTQTTTLDGVTVTPAQVTLQPGQAATVTVAFDPAQGLGFGFNQGYIILQGSQHQAHLPFFARVVEALGGGGVLVIDADMSGALYDTDYTGYYTRTLQNLGIPYDVWDTVAHLGTTRTIPDFPELAGYDAVIIFTGDHYEPDATFAIPTPLTQQDMNLLNEYAQSGGALLVMGQDATSVMGDSFLRGFMLGADPLQDSVTDNDLPSDPIIPYDDAPPAFNNIYLDLTGPNRALGRVLLTGLNERPVPVTNTGQITGEVTFRFDNFTDELAYSVEIEVSETFTLTNAHIHSGTVDVGGPVVHPTWPFTQNQVVTDTIAWSGSVVLSEEEQQMREAGALYFNVHSTAHPGGEIRGQMPSDPVVGDGAGNQFYIDELESNPDAPNPEAPEPLVSYQALLKYAGPFNEEDGVVAMAHRDQPTLERPGTSYDGRSIFTSFGLEGVNNGTGNSTTSREVLMTRFLRWGLDEPTVTISHTDEVTTSEISIFEANLSSPITPTVGVSYRWDFGDGSDYTPEYPIAEVSHHYAECGDYTVRVEAVDSWGNHAIGEAQVTILACQPERTWKLYAPSIHKN